MVKVAIGGALAVFMVASMATDAYAQPGPNDPEGYPSYDPYAEALFQVIINDVHWVALPEIWAPIPYTPVNIVDGSPDPDEDWGFYLVAADCMVDGSGYIRFDWDADSSYAQSAYVNRNRTRGFEHREDGNLTNGRVTVTTCVVQVDAYLTLWDPDCGGAIEVACQFECPQLGFQRTAMVNFGHSTSSSSIGQASYSIGGVSLSLNFSASQGAGSYLDGDVDTGGPATMLTCTVELTHRNHGRIELWASDSAFSGADAWARLKGYGKTMTELAHD